MNIVCLQPSSSLSNVPEDKWSIRKLDFNTCHCLRLVNLLCLLISLGGLLSMHCLVGFKTVGVLCVCVCVDKSV